MPRIGLPLVPPTLRWAFVAAVVLIIFVNSIVLAPPAPPGPEPNPFWDKQLHFTAYAILTISLAYATAQSKIPQTHRLFAILLIPMGYGIAIELIQAPLPDRYFSYADMLANALGAILGLTYLAIEARVPYAPIRDLF